MMPGVTYLPRAVDHDRVGGRVDVAPTAAIFPLEQHRAAPIVGPAAVRMVTLRMTVGCDGSGL